jgi:hypothetical protein
VADDDFDFRDAFEDSIGGDIASFDYRSGSTGFNVNRLGAASAAVTPVGTTPALGTAVDLAKPNGMTSDEFKEYTRLLAEVGQRNLIRLAEMGVAPSAYERELEMAENFEKYGFSMTNDALGGSEGKWTAEGEGDSWISRFGDDLQTELRMARNYLGQGVHGTGEFVGLNDKEAPDFDTYVRRGGTLSEGDWLRFSPQTRNELFDRANVATSATWIAESPGVKQALWAAQMGYRMATTPVLMSADVRRDAGYKGLIIPQMDSLSMWFDGSQWAKNWRATVDPESPLSLGNALINNLISPEVSQDTLDEWRKHSAWYAFGSTGAEFLAAWYADPAVLAIKGAGNARRVLRNEMPLNEHGQMYAAIRAAQQGREVVNLRSPITKKWAEWRAERTLEGFDGLVDYAQAKSDDFATFSMLPAFHGRSASGMAAAKAIHVAANSGDDALIDLTRRALMGSDKALEAIQKMKDDPSRAAKFVNGTNFVAAYDAVKLKSDLLTEEIGKLSARGTRSHFARWELDTDIALKQREVDEIKSWLDANDGYNQWLQSIGTSKPRTNADGALRKNVDPYNPQIERFDSPKTKWNDVEERFDTVTHRRWMPDLFDKHHTVVKVPPAVVARRIGVVSMHDLNSGKRGIERFFNQVGSVLDFEDLDNLRGNFNDRWASAADNSERYKTMYDMEEEVLIPALAGKLGTSEDTVRLVFNKINEERNRTFEGLTSNKGRMYQAGPTFAQRLQDETSSARLVGEADENGMVTLELRDGSRLVTVEVPKSLLTHQMKRHKDVLDDIDAGFYRRDAANLAEVTEVLATKFYSFWKPLQLWRLGWPQRVLMDEGFRAISIFGPMYALAGPGMESAITAGRNVPAWVRDKYRAGKHGKVDVTDGPTGPMTKAPDAFQWQRQAETAVRVPVKHYPKINPDRLSRINSVNVAAGAAMTFRDKALAIQKEMDDLADWEREILGRGTKNSLQHLIERERAMGKGKTAGKSDPLGMTPTGRHFLEWLNIDKRTERMKAWSEHPINKMDNDFAEMRNYRDDLKPVAFVYDPVNGKRITKGYFVPLADPNLSYRVDDSQPQNIMENNALRWYERNAELLSRQGIRLQVTEDGIEVGRWFNSQQRRRAEQAIKETAERLPVGEQRLTAFNLTKGHTIEALDINHISPFMESVNRGFAPENIYEDSEGIIPTTEGVEGQVWHGTRGTLPEQLLPREEAPHDNGRMMGDGLYTTVSKDLADTYGLNLYTIKDTRSGQRVNVFDTDVPFTDADIDEVVEYLRERGGDAGMLAALDFTTAVRQAQSIREDGDALGTPTFATKWIDDEGVVSWANLYEASSYYVKQSLTEFLIARRNAGALKHMGGTTRREDHQVYVWFHPEDLVVIPGQTKVGEAWVEKPMRLLKALAGSEWEYVHAETPVPESRIVRFGKRNPMLRDLHTTHARLKNTEEGTPEYDELLAREQGLMDILGLRYAGSFRRDALRGFSKKDIEDGKVSTGHLGIEKMKPNVWGQDWYEIYDKGQFNTTLNTAQRLNKEFDWTRAANGDMRRAEVDEGLSGLDYALEEFDFHLDSIPSRIADKLKREYGRGKMRLRSNGRDYDMDDVFEGNLGRLTLALTSSAPAMDVLTDAHTAALGLLRHQGAGHVRIHAPVMTPETLKVGTPENKKAILYFQRWADLMNNQVANSPVWGPMLRGASDEDVVKYLLETPQGHKHRMEILEQHESVEAYVNEMRAKLDYYLPSRELRRRLAKGPIQPSDLRRKVHNDDLPDIYGPELTLEDKKFTRALADNVWNALGTIPADKFSRQPFAKATYRRKVQSLLNQSDADFLDAAALERIHAMAAEHTREQVRQHLFDLSDGTNMTDMLRFVAPFWGAQEEAMLKWAKIISDRPETVARFFAGQRAIYNNFMVVDEEGQEVELNRKDGSIFGFGFGYHPNDKMVLQIPEVVRHTPFGKALENIGSLRIPIGSANTVLQGEMPLLPSFGPLVSIPADKIMRAWTDTHGVEFKNNTLYRWLFPIGRPNGGIGGILEQLFPGWGRRAMSAAGAEDDAAHANLWWQMAREMQLRNHEKGLPPPTPDEIEAAANLLWGARIVASFISPVQLEFTPIHQFWSDEAHRYKREYGQEWEQRFFEDYKEEAMIYAVSSSHSLAGIPPTSAGMKAWDEHKELVAQHPEFGGLIVGSDTYLDEFNYDAYKMQFGKSLGPGDSRSLREITDPREREAKAEESIGWIKFRQIDATVTAELYALGATNIQQTTIPGVAQLAQYRTSEVERLKREYPAWAIAWGTSERLIYERVEALEEIAARPEFDNRVDIQGLREYLAIRDQVAAELDAGLAGGYTSSRSLQAEENSNLREWFYDQVGTLIQNNPAFAEVYSRYLSQDLLLQGSGGYGG